MDRGYVLLADDDADDQLIFKEAFSQVCSDLDLFIVSSGIELLDYINGDRAELPSLLVIDYSMPILSGVDILKILKEQSRFVHIP